jgi:hypothetical protein
MSRNKFPPFKHQKILGLWRKSKFMTGRVLGQGDTEGPPRRLRSHQCRSDDIGQLHAAAGKLLDFFGQPLDRSSDHTSRAPTDSPDSAASLTKPLADIRLSKQAEVAELVPSLTKSVVYIGRV